MRSFLNNIVLNMLYITFYFFLIIFFWMWLEFFYFLWTHDLVYIFYTEFYNDLYSVIEIEAFLYLSLQIMVSLKRSSPF